jgi:hypothetical protein
MMITRAAESVCAWLTESGLMGLPPKDSQDDDDVNEEDEDRDQEDDEPAVIREPDE